MPAGKLDGVTIVQPVAADAGTVSPSSAAVTPASKYHRRTRVMKILSSGCEEHALPSHRPQASTFSNIAVTAGPRGTSLAGPYSDSGALTKRRPFSNDARRKP